MTKPIGNKPLTSNEPLIKWVEKMAALCKPDAIHWVDGSQEEYDPSARRWWRAAPSSS
jgi:GTP-dependent phosphoenolpyruvate carboxykinase